MTDFSVAPVKMLQVVTVLGDVHTFVPEDCEHIAIGFGLSSDRAKSLRQVAAAIKAGGWIEWAAAVVMKVEEWEEDEGYYARTMLSASHVVELTATYDEPARMDLEEA